MMTAIYALLDYQSITRYIGKSTNPEVRFKEHRKPGKWSKPWAASYLVLEWVPASENWKEREIYWIWKYRSEGHPLVNMTIGGDGIVSPSPEIRRRISEALKGRIIAPAVRARMSLGHKNRVWTPEQRQRRREQISTAHTGLSPSDEIRKKISATLSGRKQPRDVVEKRAASLRRTLASRRKIKVPKQKLPRRGENAPNVRLSGSQVISIRTKFVPGVYTKRMLAEEYGIASSTVKAILSRRLWAHI